MQRFLREDLIDEMLITEIAILIGGGERSFGQLDRHLGFELVGTEFLLGKHAEKWYRRKRG